MNLRAITLKYMGWCPGMKNAAQFIPNREIPNERLKQVSTLGGLIFLSYLVYNVVAPPRSYAWDLGFENAKYDDIYKMYVREAVGSFGGIYSFKMWAETPENTTILVQIYAVENKNYPRALYTYRNDMFYYGGKPVGKHYEGEWEFNDHYVWRVYSESKEAVFYVRLNFLRFNLRLPHGPR